MKETITAAAAAVCGRGEPATAAAPSSQALAGSDLGAALKHYRSQRSSELAQPPYCIFTNAELEALVAPAGKTKS